MSEWVDIQDVQATLRDFLRDVQNHKRVDVELSYATVRVTREHSQADIELAYYAKSGGYYNTRVLGVGEAVRVLRQGGFTGKLRRVEETRTDDRGSY